MSAVFHIIHLRYRFLSGRSHKFRASLVTQVKNLPAIKDIWVGSLVLEDLLEKEMATHSSVLARITPWTGAWWATVSGVAELDMTEVIEQGCKPHR